MQRFTSIGIRLAIIAIVVLIFLGFMVSYTVGFNEQAVITTFGRATQDSVIKGRTDAGLRLRIPFVQKVTKYDTRARLVESAPETQSTFDERQLVLTSYLAWKVNEPLQFYRRFSGAGDRERDHYREAEKLLRSKLRSAMSQTSQFRLDELLSRSEAGSRLPTLEEQMLDMLNRPAGTTDAGAALNDYGIVAVAVGVSAIALPQENTKEVFTRMNTNRGRVAAETSNQGKSLAAAIRSSASSDAKRIMAFAEQLASKVRNQGQMEVAGYTKQLNEKPELAVFLKNMEMLREAHGRPTTLVLPTSIPGLEFLRPDASNSFVPGAIPVPRLSPLMSPPSRPAFQPAPEEVPADPAREDRVAAATPESDR